MFSAYKKKKKKRRAGSFVFFRKIKKKKKKRKGAVWHYARTYYLNLIPADTLDLGPHIPTATSPS